MELISHNPYRILDLPVYSNISAVKKKLDEVGVLIRFSRSLPQKLRFSEAVLELTQSNDLLTLADKKLSTDRDRLYYSFFWFSQENDSDEKAFRFIQENDIEAAKKTWEWIVNQEEISANNLSNFKNLALLYIGSSTREHFVQNKLFFLRGIELMGQVFRSAKETGYQNKVPGASRIVNLDDFEGQFALEVVKAYRSQVGRDKTFSYQEFIHSFLKNYDSKTYQNVKEGFSGVHLDKIKKAIDNSQNLRKSNLSINTEALLGLEQTCSNALDLLKEILEESEHSLLSDKVADETLICTIAYYNHNLDEESVDLEELSETCSTILRKVLPIAVSQNIISRIEENLRIITTLPNNYESKLIELFNSYPNNIYILTRQQVEELPNRLMRILEGVNKLLAEVEQEYGRYNDYSFNLSEYTVQFCQAMAIDYANHTEDFKGIIKVFSALDNYKMSDQIRSRFDANRRTLTKNVKEQSDNDGCFGVFLTLYVIVTGTIYLIIN